ncbi:MAG: hypothetical protein JST73_08015 [Actinobacteria bacterium]|nr:hypothetical protein [Actinomycetota bacterium]
MTTMTTMTTRRVLAMLATIVFTASACAKSSPTATVRHDKATVTTAAKNSVTATASTAVPTTQATTTTLPPTTLPPTTVPAVPLMNLQQIAAGDYTSLLGKWTEEAFAVNPQDGTGEQWKPGGSDTITVSNSSIGFGGASLRNNLLTDPNGPHPLAFQTSAGCSAGSNTDQAAINWTVTFCPKGAADLSAAPGPNNGVHLDSQLDTIEIWTSNNGYTMVFTRAG